MRSFRTGVNTQFADLIDYAGDFPELSMDMLIGLHRVAMGRLSWTPKELASYLVDRGVTEHWHPFGSMLVLYCEDLGTAFHEAAVAEIESCRIALKKNAAAYSSGAPLPLEKRPGAAIPRPAPWERRAENCLRKTHGAARYRHNAPANKA